MSKMDFRFDVGDAAWWARWDSAPNYVTCPDCGGTGQITVILHDEAQMSIECSNCSRGYNPPTGRIQVYDRTARAVPVIIRGFEVRDGEVRWQTDLSYIIDDDRLFEGEQAAIECGARLATEADKAERDQIAKKEKDTRSWAWNASYHRGCIKRAEKEIAYHTAKLQAANLKVRKESQKAAE